MSALDVQVGGDHYKKYKIQPMEYSMANGLDACQHTAIKYITRFRDKGGIADLEKAKHCIDLLIEFERAGQIETTSLDSTERTFEKIHISKMPPGFTPTSGTEPPPPPADNMSRGIELMFYTGEFVKTSWDDAVHNEKWQNIVAYKMSDVRLF